MKRLIPVTAIALLVYVFLTGSQAWADPGKHQGTIQVVEKDSLTYKTPAQKGGRKPELKKVKIEERTKITLDGKEATLADLKRGYYVHLVSDDGFAITIDATVYPPSK